MLLVMKCSRNNVDSIFVSSLSLVRLGVDFVLPLSQQEEQEQESPPKSTRRKCTKDLRFGTET